MKGIQWSPRPETEVAIFSFIHFSSSDHLLKTELGPTAVLKKTTTSKHVSFLLHLSLQSFFHCLSPWQKNHTIPFRVPSTGLFPNKIYREFAAEFVVVSVSLQLCSHSL